ncbi:MAG: galactokinase [Planctomycetota bacterium]
MVTTSLPLADCLRRWRELPSSEAHAFFAPGRANLLGAHMDYNGGAVMPVALSKGTYAVAGLRDDGRIHLQSAQFPDEAVEFALDELRPGRTKGWSAYVEGGLWAAMERFGALPGLDLVLHADLPMAKGLSSSASVECLAVQAVARLHGIEPEVDLMIHLAHAAETQYVGVRCGILDQTAIFLGQPDTVLHFDCLELTREHVPLDRCEARIAIMDTGVARELASSAFNQRVAECTRALSVLQEHLPGITCLRDVPQDDLARLQEHLPPVLQSRARHVVEEFARTMRGADALRRGDVAGFGACMTQAHASLRDQYAVSTPELDVMVAAATSVDGCYGARLTGAGFGGCVVAVVHPDHGEAFERHVVRAYQDATGRLTEVQWFDPAGGPREIALD